MIRFATLVKPNYNIYRRTGLSEGMPLTNQNAAQQIVSDFIKDGSYIDFVELLVRMSEKGYMGRQVALKGLNDVVAGLIQEGYSYDKITGQFFENQRERITPNWGRLLEGDERRMTVLRLDIVGNSALVRENSREKINKAFNGLRSIVNKAVTGRLGRIWTWEGDGALAAFLFGTIERSAVCCGMDILHELFFFNKLRNPLSSPIKVRLAVNSGTIQYSTSDMELLKDETIKDAITLESKAPSDSMAVSYGLINSIDQITADSLTAEKSVRGLRYRLYNIGVEKS
jgi:hypothetical protein